MSDSIYFKRSNWNTTYVPDTNEPIYLIDVNELRIGSGSVARGIGYMSQPISSRYTIFVSPSGSFSASGLSPSNTTTLLGAIDKAKKLTWNNENALVIQLADGTYNISQSIVWQNEWKNGPLHIWGNFGAPQNVVINTSHNQSWGGVFSAVNSALYVAGMSIQTSWPDDATNYQVALSAYNGGHLHSYHMRLGGVFNRYVNIGDQSVALFDGTLNFYGKARNEAFCVYRCSEIMIYNTTMSFSGNPSIGTFIYCGEQSLFNNYVTTNFSGSRSVSGKYYMISFGSIRNAAQYPGTTTAVTNNLLGILT